MRGGGGGGGGSHFLAAPPTAELSHTKPTQRANRSRTHESQYGGPARMDPQIVCGAARRRTIEPIPFGPQRPRAPVGGHCAAQNDLKWALRGPNGPSTIWAKTGPHPTTDSVKPLDRPAPPDPMTKNAQRERFGPQGTRLGPPCGPCGPVWAVWPTLWGPCGTASGYGGPSGHMGRGPFRRSQAQFQPRPNKLRVC